MGAGFVVFGWFVAVAAMKKLAWHEFKAILPEGSLVAGVVLKHEPYGVFVDIGHGYDGIIQITDFNDHGVVTTKDYPPVGTRLLTTVLGFEDHGFQVWLGVKPRQM